MKHVVIGGAGFTGRFLVRDLILDKQKVLVCDVQGETAVRQDGAEFLSLDITDPNHVDSLQLQAEDIVYHLAANQYHLPVPYFNRSGFFNSVNVIGTKNILRHMQACGCNRMIYLSTDMVYGIPESIPVDHLQQRRPIGEYGSSKKLSEDLIFEYRKRGMNITIFRPRLIVGPGRLGVLTKLFDAIMNNRPVPLIGDGSNCYQMISVYDCITAIRKAVEQGVPNDEFNLGSDNPPKVYELLENLINAKGSRSRLVKTPGGLVKSVLAMLDAIGLTVLYKEQYAIADIDYVLNINHTKQLLSWKPNFSDEQMLGAAFDEYLNPAGKN